MGEEKPGDRRPRRIGFLLAQAGAHASARFSKRVAELGLTPSEAGVIRLIGATPGLSQRLIADRTHTVPSRIVQLIDGLESRGLVDRTRSAADRRNYELRLTEGGRHALRGLREVAEAHEAEIQDGLTAEQAEQLATLLEVLRRAHHLDPDLDQRTAPG